MNNLKVTCPNPNCLLEYTIILDRQLIRTLPQNSLYWGVYIKIIANTLGYLPEELHEEFKLMFNPKDSKFIPGGRVGGSTTKMTRRDFTEYLEKIRVWAFTYKEIDLPEAE